VSRWLSLFQSSKPVLAPSDAVPSKAPSNPAIRPAYQVEPFYGTENYVAGPEQPDYSPSAADAVVEALEFESSDPDDLELVEVPGIGVETPNTLTGPATRVPHPSEVEERVVRCLDCSTELHVSRQATSTLCRRCGCYVSLEDFDIRGHRRENIRTRGNVVIHRRASLSASEVACESLKVFGKISGKIDCSGDAMFRSSGKVVGAVRCRHIYVHKLSNIRFIPGIRAENR